jgi:hypothetical protein
VKHVHVQEKFGQVDMTIITFKFKTCLRAVFEFTQRDIVPRVHFCPTAANVNRWQNLANFSGISHQRQQSRGLKIFCAVTLQSTEREQVGK